MLPSITIMKRPIFFSLLLLVIFSFSHSLSAQNYETALSLRAGTASGVGIKKVLGRGSPFAVEALALYRLGGARAVILFEGHVELYDGGYLVLGAGGHGGYRFVSVENRSFPVAGLDAIIEYEHELYNAPIVMGLYFKPHYEFLIPQLFYTHNIGLSVKILMD